MKLKITLIHEPGEDRNTACAIEGGVTLHYPELGHIVVPADSVILASDAYETLGSVNTVHEAASANAEKHEPIKPAAIEPAAIEANQSEYAP